MRLEAQPPTSLRGRSFYAPVVAFPVSCLVVTLLSDLAYWKTASVLWETISVWLLALAVVGFALALVAGLVDLIRSQNVRGLGQPWPRVLGQLVAAALSGVNVLVHSRDAYTAVVPEGLILSGLAVLILLVTAALGTPASSRRASMRPA